MIKRNNIISIIIITYNKSYELDLVLSSIVNQNYDLKRIEIVIVDDGSNDNTPAVIDKYIIELNIRYIKNMHCGIRGALRNKGASLSHGERIIFLDSDMICSPNLIEAHDRLTYNNVKNVSLGTRSCLLEYDHAFFTPDVIINNFEIITDFPATNDERTLSFKYFNNFETEYPSTMWTLLFSHNFCIWKELFFKVGSFDDLFSKYWGAEDVELGYRLFLNSCALKINTQAHCYHLYHSTDSFSKIEQLKHNYSIFLNKHNNFEIELFCHEYKIWTIDYYHIRTCLINNKHIINYINKDNVLNNIIGTGISFGVLINQYFINKHISTCFIPNYSSYPDSRMVNLIGLNTNLPEKSTDFSLVSSEYRNIYPALFDLIIQEAQKISKTVYICYPLSIVKITNSNYKKYLVPKDKLLIFAISSIAYYSSPFDRNSIFQLSFALSQIGYKPSIQFPYDPLSIYPINNGFYKIGNKTMLSDIRKMFLNKYSLYNDSVPCIFSEFRANLLLNFLGKRIYWKEEDHNIVSEAIKNDSTYETSFINIKLSRRLQNMFDFDRIDFIPVGINSLKINQILSQKNINKSNNKPFIFLWVNPFIHEQSDIKVLITAFTEEFTKNDNVHLKIVFSGYKPVTFKSFFLNHSYTHIINEHMHMISQKMQRYYKDIFNNISGKYPISFLKGDISNEKITSLLLECDCLIETNTTLDISPVVLESIALGKKPILKNDGTYMGYFPNECFIEVSFIKKSGIFSDPLPENVGQSTKDILRYQSYNYIIKDDLKNKMRNVYENPNNLIINKTIRDDFQYLFQWPNIANKLSRFLKSI